MVPPSDAQALSAAIELLLDGSELRSAVTLAAREKIRLKYNLHDNVRRLAEVFTRRLQVELNQR